MGLSFLYFFNFKTLNKNTKLKKKIICQKRMAKKCSLTDLDIDEQWTQSWLWACRCEQPKDRQIGDMWAENTVTALEQAACESKTNGR